MVDHDSRQIASFHAGGRRAEILVAGPAALLVSKLHKLSERIDDPDRLKDKDALDVLRLLRGTDPADMAAAVGRLLADVRSEAVTT